MKNLFFCVLFFFLCSCNTSEKNYNDMKEEDWIFLSANWENAKSLRALNDKIDMLDLMSKESKKPRMQITIRYKDGSSAITKYKLNEKGKYIKYDASVIPSSEQIRKAVEESPNAKSITLTVDKEGNTIKRTVKDKEGNIVEEYDAKK